MGAFLYYGAALLGLFLIQKLLFFAWWNPRKIEKNLNAQGIKGPPYRFLFGNLKDLAKIYRDPSSWIVPSKRKTTHPTLQQALPHYQKWRDEYGKIYLYWFGPRPRVVINDPELAKEIMGNLRLFPKSLPHPAIFQMVGHSLIASEGDRWTGRRKFMNPFFNIESLKDLAPTVVRCTKDMLENWNNLIGKSSEKEIEVFAQFQSLTKDFIARALCGDGDCDEARRIFDHQAEQIHLVADALRMFYITGTRFLPTPFNIKSWIVNRRINKMFMDLLWKRYKTGGSGNPLNMPKCAEKLVTHLEELKKKYNTKNVYLATDYPLNNSFKSFSFHNIQHEYHGKAIDILKDKVDFLSWFNYTPTDQFGKKMHINEFAQSGIPGILDKLVCSRAKIFLVAPPECRKKTSSYTSMIISERHFLMKAKVEGIENISSEW